MADDPTKESVTGPLEAETDPEPEATEEIQGRRMVDVSVVASERRAARERTTKEIREKEVAPLQQQVAQLGSLQAEIQALRQQLHPPRAPTPDEQTISDTEAETYARRYELYDPTTARPDVTRAKAIMADHRRQTAEIARQAAQEAVLPLQQMTAEQASRANFVTMAQLRTPEGQPLIDPELLAREWAALPAELTQHLQVAETVLNAAIGKSQRTGRRVAPPTREPIVSESAGGAVRPERLAASPLEKRLGLTDADIRATKDRFVAGGVSVIGE